ncbi:MAG TPA: discoidin domain-containing protein, partial [Symbiobacteriaceae bacterium]|nr:discoidin domain-containing protein [Symbiobacteriaceae bacterium]
SALDAEASPGAASFLLSAMDGTEIATEDPIIAGNTVTLRMQDKSVDDQESLIVRYDPNRAGALRGEAAPLLPLTDLARGKSLTGDSVRQLDLGDVYRIDEWKLFGNDSCCDDLTISLSLDGNHWAPVHAHSGPGTINADARPYLRLQPPVKAARYLRVSGAGAVNITKVQAWGGSAGNPAAAPAPLTGTDPVNVALEKATSVTGTPVPGHGPELGVNGAITVRTAENGQHVPDYFEVSGSDPAWQVDLGGLYFVSSIRVYNRSDCCYAEADGFLLETSVNGSDWLEVEHSDEPFGGLDNAPYIRSDLPERLAGHVRVRLVGPDRTLHLAEVQVYGVPAIASLLVTYHDSGPVLSQGIDAIDNVVTLRYDKVMDRASVPPPDSFAVQVDGATHIPGAVQIFGQNVVLYLPVRTDPTMHVAVSYSPKPPGPTLQDLTGKAADPIDLQDARYLAAVPENYALYKPVSYDGTEDEDHPATRGVNGVRYYEGDAASKAYDYFSISAGDSAPSWQVDMRDVYAIRKIRIFKRFDDGWADADHLRIQLSVDGATWRTVYVNDQQLPTPTFGNEPLVVDLTYENARYVRLALDGPGTLSLAEVQVYGLPVIQAWNVALDRPVTATSAAGTYTQWTDIHLGAQPPDGKAESDLHNPARANDGNSKKAAKATIWEVNLFRPYTLSRINILKAEPAAPDTFMVEVMQPDSTEWQTLDLTNRQLTDGNLLSIMVPGVEASRVRLTAAGDTSLYEVEILGFPPTDLEGQRPLQNLALHKPASLLSAAGTITQWEIPLTSDKHNPTPEPTVSPALAVDGNESTFAALSPMAAKDPSCDCRAAWWVDLQESYQLTRATIRFESAGQASAFSDAGKVAISSDGSTWTEIALEGLASLDGAVLTLPLPGMQARFVRLAVDGIDPLLLVEVEVYGYDTELDR